jgi:hypothetical protein
VRGVEFGSDNLEINSLIVMADWMANTGKGSADWMDLSDSDRKLLIVNYFARERRNKSMMKLAIQEAFSKNG